MTTRFKTDEPTATDLADIQPLNHHILEIDLDDLEVETLDQRIELSLAALFGVEGAAGDLVTENGPCGQFTCTGYWPSN